MVQILKEGTFDADVRNALNFNLQQAMGVSSGNVVYLDPLNGADAGSDRGQYPSTAYGSLAAGYAALREGKNDVLCLIGNGLTTATARLSAGFTWAKNAAHLVGVCSPVAVGKRARIAPTTGITAFANFFTMSGSGNLVKGVQFFHGFTAGTTNMICLTVSGGRNAFVDCDIQGMGDTDGASGADTGSRNLLIKTTGENTFLRCTIGLDTVIRSVANYSVEWQTKGGGAGIPRNYFKDCLFAQWSSAATASALYSAAYGAERWQIFDNCVFYNEPNAAGYLASTGVLTTVGSVNAKFLFKNCTCVGFTGWGYDANSRGDALIDGGGPSANATISETGIAVAPNV